MVIFTMPHNEHSCQKHLRSILKFDAQSKKDEKTVTTPRSVVELRQHRMALIGSGNTFQMKQRAHSKLTHMITKVIFAQLTTTKYPYNPQK